MARPLYADWEIEPPGDSGASAYRQATTLACPVVIACAAYWSIVPALDPYALIALTSVRSSSPSDIWSIGAISGE